MPIRRSFVGGGRVDTLGELVAALETRKIAAEQTDPEMAHALWDAIRGFQDRPGVEEIRAIANRLFGQELTYESIRRLRGELCLRIGITPEAANAIRTIEVPTKLSAVEKGNTTNSSPKQESQVEVLDPDEIAILETLAEQPRRTWTQVDVAAALDSRDGTPHAGRKTVGKRLAGLRQRGLVDRPNGSRRGDAITNAGLSVIGR